MKKEYVALEGKVFAVELLSNMGSTNYGWCISGLPEQIILMGTENISMGSLCGVSVLQRFYFGAVSSDKINVDISFTLNSWSNLTDVADEFTAKVRIIPSNSEEFVSFSENAANTAMPYGLVYTGCSTQNPRLAYGFPFEGPDLALKYGYPCGAQDATLKYGYPCGAQDAALKYGYPCGAQDAALKYGYPCGVQDATLKYGYPCGAQDAALKYGYPCGAQDAALKYGYPCLEYTKETRPYGYPF